MSRRVHLAPGTYTVRNITAGTDATVDVPTLTVAIAQASPAVGQTLTLTTNAAAGAAYQWRAGGVDIGGATAATFDTTGRSAGDVITCRVVSGAQTVTSAGVTLGAASLSRTFLGMRERTGAGALVVSFADYTNPAPAAGQRLLVFLAGEGSGGANDLRLIVNGGAPVAHLRSLRNSGDNCMACFELAAPAGSTITLQADQLPSANISTLNCAAYIVSGGVLVDSAAIRGASPQTVNVNVPANGAVFAASSRTWYSSAALDPMTGVTEDGVIGPQDLRAGSITGLSANPAYGVSGVSASGTSTLMAISMGPA